MEAVSADQDSIALSIGVDIGQQRDPSAIAVVEESRGGARRDETLFTVRMAERLPLGTPYPAVAERVGEVVRNLYRLWGGARPYYEYGVPRSIPILIRTDYPLAPRVAVDVTGVGRPVYELIEAALDREDDAVRRADGRGLDRLDWQLLAVTFTFGDRLTMEGGEWRLGKAFLVSRLVSLLQTRRLRFAGFPEASDLARELLAYEIKVSENANEQYGAFKVGTHDDLVTAVGLAVCDAGPSYESF